MTQPGPRSGAQDPRGRLHLELDASCLGAVPVAELTLRFGKQRLQGRVYWPPSPPVASGSALTVVLEDTDAADDLATADLLCRGLCSTAAAALAVRSGSEAPSHERGLAALGWAAEHAHELGADPRRLVVAGCGGAGAGAAWLAIKARDRGWPELHRQVLVHPTFTPGRSMPCELAAVAPATVLTGGDPGDDGGRYAARLRSAGIAVDVIDTRLPAGRKVQWRV